VSKADILIAGVGGQGIVLASDIIAETALAAGNDVKKTDTLGMAQRGGRVVSHVRFAARVYSPLVTPGEVDILLALEKLEAARWIPYLRAGGVALVNNHALPPLSVSLGQARYPADAAIIRLLRQRTQNIYLVEGSRRAQELGNARAVNSYMLGCLSVFLPFPAALWRRCISWRLPEKFRRINLAVFARGRQEIRAQRTTGGG